VLLAMLALTITAVVGCWYARRLRRRRDESRMVVTTYPEIELQQPYGGWDADAYDAGTGHGPPMSRVTWHSGPPSTWARHP
jgi:hypothetical protein